MKDNGKTEAVKNCTTCRHIDKLGKGLPCSECRMSYPPADADDYNLMWELRETLAEVPQKKREIVPGDEVIFCGKICKVLSVCECDGIRQLEVLEIEIDEDNSGEFEISRMMLREEMVSLKLPELTAKEYAEKLREYFGKPEIGELDIQVFFCSERPCKECAFNPGPGRCAAAVCMFDPERALQMIQEAENKDKPKGKTYLEDFREKFPSCVLCSDGTPALCRCEAYGGNCAVSDYPEDEECVHCWNEVMPEAGDEK